MYNLVLCLTLLNIAISSNSATTYNKYINQISRIINEPMPCQAYNGMLLYPCNKENFETILKHYKMEPK